MYLTEYILDNDGKCCTNIIKKSFTKCFKTVPGIYKFQIVLRQNVIFHFSKAPSLNAYVDMFYKPLSQMKKENKLIKNPSAS